MAQGICIFSNPHLFVFVFAYMVYAELVNNDQMDFVFFVHVRDEM